MTSSCLLARLTGIFALLLQASPSLAVPPNQARLFEGMGPHTRPISTNSPEAQRWFDQGLTWMFAFNHDEAIRSFTRAAELDEDCAMPWWGVSLAAGPQYNHPVITEERNTLALEAMEKALSRIDSATPVERALIKSLDLRNPGETLNEAERAPYHEAYAAQLGKIWKAHPNDADVGVLYAEAMMLRRPWMLFSVGERKPHKDTPEILAVLERAIALDPDHPGALHLYIHAIEASPDPSMGLFAADRLSDLVPGSGHMLHMPSHLYVQTGDWDRAIEQNWKALRSDDLYRQLAPKIEIQHGYMIHNAHMLAFAAMMSGRETEAMAAARDMWNDLSEEELRAVGPFFDAWMCSVYDVQKRFGRWDGILAEPAPPEFLPITRATWRACRAVAFAAKKDFENAEREYAHFREAKQSLPEKHLFSTYDLAETVLEVANLFIPGEIALQQGDWNAAVAYLTQAAAIEDTLGYGEPPQWLQPVRHTLGAVYLKAGRPAEAERAYREDLAKWPDNGWSLFGLSRALEEQGKTEEAAQFRKAYERVWAQADAPIGTSCLCLPE